MGIIFCNKFNRFSSDTLTNLQQSFVSMFYKKAAVKKFSFNKIIIALRDVIKKANFIASLIVTQRMDFILIKATLIIMCLNLPLKLKRSWHFVKRASLNTVFMTQRIHFCGLSTILLYIP